MDISKILANPRTRSMVERMLARQGTHGDNMVVHVNPMEVQQLRLMGGVGTKNPRTGLLQFYGGISGGDTRADPGAAGGGNSGGATGGGGTSGGGIRGGDTRADPGAFGGGTSDPAYGGSGAAGADYTGGTGYPSHAVYHDNVVKALGNWDTYANSSGPLGFLGNHLLGLGWVDPTKTIGTSFKNGTPVPSNPNTSVDALGLGLGALGFLAPGLGTLADLGLYGARKLGAIPGDFGTIDAGNWGGGIFGGSGSGSNTPGSIGGNGSPGNFGGYGGPVSVPSATGTAAGAGVPAASAGTPAATTPGTTPSASPAATAAGATQGLAPLMMPQPSTDLTGGRFGAVPSFAMNPYQIGTVPTNMQPPAIPGTPFAPPPTTTGGGTGTGTGGQTRTTWLQSIFGSQYPQVAQWLQANPYMARKWGYA